MPNAANPCGKNLSSNEKKIIRKFKRELNALPYIPVALNCVPTDFYKSLISDVKIAIFKIEMPSPDVRDQLNSDYGYLLFRFDPHGDENFEAYVTKNTGFGNGASKVTVDKALIEAYFALLEKSEDALKLLN